MIHFDFDKSNIRKGDAKILDGNADWLKANPNMLLLITGNTDDRGTVEYNLALGDRRAKAAQNYLVSKGVAGDRISTVSYGEERPICTDKPPKDKCHAMNRNDQFLTKPK